MITMTPTGQDLRESAMRIASLYRVNDPGDCVDNARILVAWLTRDGVDCETRLVALRSANTAVPMPREDTTIDALIESAETIEQFLLYG